MKRIRPVQPSDSPELAEILTRSWGSTEMDTRGRLVDILALPGFIAETDDAWRPRRPKLHVGFGS
jgi:hypothetical protein